MVSVVLDRSTDGVGVVGELVEGVDDDEQGMRVVEGEAQGTGSSNVAVVRV